jgi:hypothetical protein
MPRFEYRFVIFPPPKHLAGIATAITLAKLAEDNLPSAYTAIVHFGLERPGVLLAHDIF